MEWTGPIKIHKKRLNKRNKAKEISKTVLVSLLIFILSTIVEMIVKTNNIYDKTTFIRFIFNYSIKYFTFSMSYLVFAVICLLIFKILGKDKIYKDYFPSFVRKMFFCNAILALVFIIIGKIIR